MMEYQYKAISRDGTIVTGSMRVESETILRDRLNYAGLTLIDSHSSSNPSALTIISSHFSKIDKKLRRASEQQIVTSFLGELAMLLSADVRLDAALKMLEENADRNFQITLQSINSALTSGLSLSDALEQQSDTFDQITIALIRAGETSGRLPTVLHALASMRERNTTFRRNVMAPLRYPIFLLSAAVLVLAFFLLYILPQFVELFRDFDTAKDPFIHYLIAFIKWTERSSTLLASIFLCGSTALTASLFLRSTRIFYERLLNKLSIVRDIKELYRTVLFCRILSMTLNGGIGMTQSIVLISGVVSSTSTRDTWRTAYEQIRRGSRLTDALVDTKLITSTSLRLLKIGEETGYLAKLSENAANFHELRLERKLNAITSIIGPAAIIFISSIVGGIIVALMTSLVSLGQVVR